MHGVLRSRSLRPLESLMGSVLLLFLLPVGGGIPAGVLLAQSKGYTWGMTAGLYVCSDVILALVFEPILHLLRHWGKKVEVLARMGAAMKQVLAQSMVKIGGKGVGPLSLILLSFSLDPMSGRTATAVAGHGFLSGWALAIVGDMLFYGVVAATTLGLNAYVRNPQLTVFLVLVAMLLVPMLVQARRDARKNLNKDLV